MQGKRTRILILAVVIASSVSVSVGADTCQDVFEEYMAFKLRMVEDYLGSQWALLQSNELTHLTEYVEVVHISVQAFITRTLITNPNEIFLGLSDNNEVLFASGEVNLTDAQLSSLRLRISEEPRSALETEPGGVEFMGAVVEPAAVTIVFLYSSRHLSD